MARPEYIGTIARVELDMAEQYRVWVIITADETAMFKYPAYPAYDHIQTDAVEYYNTHYPPEA